MPRPATHLPPVQAIVKMVNAPPNCHCEGALRPWQSRGGTADSYRLPLKWYAPIASVAAVTAQPLAALPPYGCGVPFTGSDRHWQLQISGHHRRPHTPL